MLHYWGCHISTVDNKLLVICDYGKVGRPRNKYQYKL